MEEGTAWLLAVYQHRKSTSMDSLFTFFRGPTKKSADLTPAIRNMVSATVKQLFPASSGSNPEVADMAQCTTYLYYTVAEHVLQQLFPGDAAGSQQQQQARQRFKGLLKTAVPPQCTELVSHEEWHAPLLECAAHLVAFATSSPEQGLHFPWATHVLDRQPQAAALWQAARDFQDCFSAGSRFPLPAALQQHLRHMQSAVLEHAAFSSGSIWFSLASNEGCALNRGNKLLLGGVLKAYAQQAVERTQLLAWSLQQQQQAVALPADFHEQCVWLLDQALLRHLPICFGQHMSVVVACVVYMTAKVLQASLTFNSITEMAVRLFDGTSPETFQQVEVEVARQAGAGPRFGDVRAFYNDRFLPALQGNVRRYLQGYASRQITHAGTTLQQSPAAAVAAADAGVSAAAAGGSRAPLTVLCGNPASQPAGSTQANLLAQQLTIKPQQQQAGGGAAGGAAGGTGPGSRRWSLPLLSGNELQPWQEAEDAKGLMPALNATCAAGHTGPVPQQWQQQVGCTPVRQMR